MKYLLAIMIFSLFADLAYSDETFSWTDDNGNIHFTDDISTVPKKFRQKNNQPKVSNVDRSKTYDYDPNRYKIVPNNLTIEEQRSLMTKCFTAVKKVIITPKTATFPLDVLKIGAQTDKNQLTYFVLSNVDMQNKYGATVRNEFVCWFDARTSRLQELMVNGEYAPIPAD